MMIYQMQYVVFFFLILIYLSYSLVFLAGTFVSGAAVRLSNWINIVFSKKNITSKLFKYITQQLLHYKQSFCENCIH